MILDFWLSKNILFLNSISALEKRRVFLERLDENLKILEKSGNLDSK